MVCKGAIQGSVSIVTGAGNVVADKRFIGKCYLIIYIVKLYIIIELLVTLYD